MAFELIGYAICVAFCAAITGWGVVMIWMNFIFGLREKTFVMLAGIAILLGLVGCYFAVQHAPVSLTYNRS